MIWWNELAQKAKAAFGRKAKPVEVKAPESEPEVKVLENKEVEIEQVEQEGPPIRAFVGIYVLEDGDLELDYFVDENINNELEEYVMNVFDKIFNKPFDGIVQRNYNTMSDRSKAFHQLCMTRKYMKDNSPVISPTDTFNVKPSKED